MELDFQPTFITLRFCLRKAIGSVKMNRNGNMIEEKREKKLTKVVKAAVHGAFFQAFVCY